MTISLGPCILRAETAALVAVVLVQQGMGKINRCVSQAFCLPPDG
jgi:hypothetical protein